MLYTNKIFATLYGFFKENLMSPFTKGIISINSALSTSRLFHIKKFPPSLPLKLVFQISSKLSLPQGTPHTYEHTLFSS